MLNSKSLDPFKHIIEGRKRSEMVIEFTDNIYSGNEIRASDNQTGRSNSSADYLEKSNIPSRH